MYKQAIITIMLALVVEIVYILNYTWRIGICKQNAKSISACFE